MSEKKKMCWNCKHFKIQYEPIKSKGACWDLGRAKCMKYDLVVDFLNHGKLKRLECAECKNNKQREVIENERRKMEGL